MASRANHLSTFVRTLYGISGAVKSAVRQKVAAELIDFGAEMADRAAATKSFQNRTHNLISSYGSSLFVGGREWRGVVDTKAVTEGPEYPARHYASGTAVNFLPQRKTPDGLMETGYDAVERFFNEYESEGKCPKDKWQVVVVAAMFYGSAVELKYKYQVISGIASEFNASNIVTKYKGRVKDFSFSYSK